MRMQTFFIAILLSLEIGGVSPAARALTRDEIRAKLESAGYSQIREVPSGKIKSFKAVKGGKEISIIVDSSGHIQELQ